MTIELNPERTRRALVVGGGPVGALTALSLEKRGWDVELWEARDGECSRRHCGPLALLGMLVCPPSHKGSDAFCGLPSGRAAAASCLSRS